MHATIPTMERMLEEIIVEVSVQHRYSSQVLAREAIIQSALKLTRRSAKGLSVFAVYGCSDSARL